MSRHPKMTSQQEQAMIETVEEVRGERYHQQYKWGEQNWPDGTGDELAIVEAEVAKMRCELAFKDGKLTYRHILDEEVCEAFAETDPEKIYAELIQVAAVAVAWAEAIKRRP